MQFTLSLWAGGRGLVFRFLAVLLAAVSVHFFRAGVGQGIVSFNFKLGGKNLSSKAFCNDDMPRHKSCKLQKGLERSAKMIKQNGIP